MTLKMRNHKVLVRKIEPKMETEDGLIFTQDQCMNTTEGVIVAVPPMTNEMFEYKVGDVVLFSQFAGENLYVDGQKLIIIDSENIFATRDIQ
jgi:chaperonin GroES